MNLHSPEKALKKISFKLKNLCLINDNPEMITSFLNTKLINLAIHTNFEVKSRLKSMKVTLHTEN